MKYINNNLSVEKIKVKKPKIKKFDNFINESMITDDLINKLSDDYKEIQEESSYTCTP